MISTVVVWLPNDMLFVKTGANVPTVRNKQKIAGFRTKLFWGSPYLQISTLGIL